jgi:holo-[acyl-carrier protein] synthase
MNIIAIGIDATDIPRIASTLARYGDRFLQRVFTEAEIAYCSAKRDMSPHLAARFAAKEAGMKALGTGHSQGVLWRDIEVIRRGGPPQLRFHNAAARRLQTIGAERALLSLTHSDALAFAHVLLVAS